MLRFSSALNIKEEICRGLESDDYFRSTGMVVSYYIVSFTTLVNSASILSRFIEVPFAMGRHMLTRFT